MAPALFFVCFKTPFLLQRAFWAILYTFVLALHTLRHKTGLFTWSRHKSVHFGAMRPKLLFFNRLYRHRFCGKLYENKASKLPLFQTLPLFKRHAAVVVAAGGVCR